MSSKQLPPIFVINLERSTDRLRFVKEQLDNVGVHFTRLCAVEGVKIEPNLLSQYISDSSRTITHFTTLSPGEIGCALSQRKGWTLAAEGDARATVILEDDIEIYDNFKYTIEKLFEVMDENIVVDLKTKKGFLEIERRVIDNQVSLVRYSTPPLATQGAIFGRKAAKKLLVNCKGFSAPIDNLMQKVSQHGVQIWSLETGCLSHQTAGAGGATIKRPRSGLTKIKDELARPFWRLSTKISNFVYHKLAERGS